MHASLELRTFRIADRSNHVEPASPSPSSIFCSVETSSDPSKSPEIEEEIDYLVMYSSKTTGDFSSSYLCLP